MRETKDVPKQVEMHTVNCKCDHCGKSLNSMTKIWAWNEHLGCCRECVQRAQGNTNSLASLKTFKQSVEKAEERDIDLL